MGGTFQLGELRPEGFILRLEVDDLLVLFEPLEHGVFQKLIGLRLNFCPFLFGMTGPLIAQ